MEQTLGDIIVWIFVGMVAIAALVILTRRR